MFMLPRRLDLGGGLRAPRSVWAGFLAVVGMLGLGLLILASVIGGQHAHGHWVQPTKLAGVLVLAIAVGLGAALFGPLRPNR